jgi:hypothetical protein
MGAGTVTEPEKLRELASWYRAFAERAGNPAIWECRLRTADDLDEEARRLEQAVAECRAEARRKRKPAHPQAA